MSNQQCSFLDSFVWNLFRFEKRTRDSSSLTPAKSLYTKMVLIVLTWNASRTCPKRSLVVLRNLTENCASTTILIIINLFELYNSYVYPTDRLSYLKPLTKPTHTCWYSSVTVEHRHSELQNSKETKNIAWLKIP